jgi:hypothetical protein
MRWGRQDQDHHPHECIWFRQHTNFWSTTRHERDSNRNKFSRWDPPAFRFRRFYALTLWCNIYYWLVSRTQLDGRMHCFLLLRVVVLRIAIFLCGGDACSLSSAAYWSHQLLYFWLMANLSSVYHQSRKTPRARAGFALLFLQYGLLVERAGYHSFTSRCRCKA